MILPLRVLPTVMITVLICAAAFSAPQDNMGNMAGMNHVPLKNETHSQTAFQSRMDRDMAKMNRAMMAAPMNGNPDHDFAAMMIPHHQGAVDMARTELLYGKNPVLRRLAQEIIVAQQQEIGVMQRQLNAPSRSRQKVGVVAPPRPSSATLSVSTRDRVYTGDQTSNTVSVISPATNRLLGVIRLGQPVPTGISPLYGGSFWFMGWASRRITGRLRSSPLDLTPLPLWIPPRTRYAARSISDAHLMRAFLRRTASSSG